MPSKDIRPIPESSLHINTATEDFTGLWTSFRVIPMLLYVDVILVFRVTGMSVTQQAKAHESQQQYIDAENE